MNTGKKKCGVVGSRVASEIQATSCSVVSTMAELCRSEFVLNPYTYSTKDCSSYLCIDYFLSAGLVSVVPKTIGLDPDCGGFRTNDHFPISGYFCISPPVAKGTLPLFAASPLTMCPVLATLSPTLAFWAWLLLHPPFRSLLSHPPTVIFWRKWLCPPRLVLIPSCLAGRGLHGLASSRMVPLWNVMSSSGNCIRKVASSLGFHCWLCFDSGLASSEPGFVGHLCVDSIIGGICFAFSR